MSTTVENKVASEFLEVQQACVSVLKRWAVEGRDDASDFDRAIFSRAGWDDKRIEVELSRMQTSLHWKPKLLPESKCKELEADAAALEVENQKAVEALNAKIAELQSQIQSKRIEVEKLRQKAVDGRQAREAVRNNAPLFARKEHDRAVKAWNDAEYAKKTRELGVEVTTVENVLKLQLSQQTENEIVAHLETVLPDAIVKTEYADMGKTFVRKSVDPAKWTAYQAKLRQKLPQLRQQLAERQAENERQLERIASETLDGYLS